MQLHACVQPVTHTALVLLYRYQRRHAFYASAGVQRSMTAHRTVGSGYTNVIGQYVVCSTTDRADITAESLRGNTVNFTIGQAFSSASKCARVVSPNLLSITTLSVRTCLTVLGIENASGHPDHTYQMFDAGWRKAIEVS